MSSWLHRPPSFALDDVDVPPSMSLSLTLRCHPVQQPLCNSSSRLDTRPNQSSVFASSIRHAAPNPKDLRLAVWCTQLPARWRRESGPPARKSSVLASCDCSDARQRCGRQRAAASPCRPSEEPPKPATHHARMHGSIDGLLTRHAQQDDVVRQVALHGVGEVLAVARRHHAVCVCVDQPKPISTRTIQAMESGQAVEGRTPATMRCLCRREHERCDCIYLGRAPVA